MVNENSLQLSASLFVVLSILQLTAFSQSPEREVAVTFDDLPATRGDLAKLEYITRNLLPKLKASHIYIDQVPFEKSAWIRESARLR
jgi:hypothetical protein